MLRIRIETFLLLALAGCTTPHSPPQATTESSEPVTAYVDGRVYDGERFVSRPLFVRGSRFVEEPAEAPARTISLEGRYVIPPYTEAHHHVTPATKEGSDRFLKRGIFYALNANTIVGPFEGRSAFLKRPDTYDVKLAMGGITEPRGHPEKLYVDVLGKYVYKGWTRERFLGDAFHFAEDLPQFESALTRLKEQGSHIVKTYLLHSEEYEKRKNDDAYYGAKGLNPHRYADYVRAAHDRGLPVAVHVETAHDALVAARAKADLLVHLPGYNSIKGGADQYRLDEKTIAALKAAQIPVVATYVLARSRYKEANLDEEKRRTRDAHYALQADNIRRLETAGIPVLTGTDGFASSPVDEAKHLVQIGAWTKARAVAALTNTARYIFPKRHLSCLDVGCEADFLVLRQDPTSDLDALEQIERYVKAGHPLAL